MSKKEDIFMENQNTVQQVVSEQPKKKKGKKKWIILAVIAVLFIAVASSGSSEPTVETSPNGSVSETKEKEEKETEAAKADTQEIKAGSSVSDDYVKITYKSCNADFRNYSRYADVKSGYKVIQAVFDFENISTTDQSLNSFYCYADGVKCEEFYMVDDYSSPLFETISPGRKLTGATIYFEVPKEVEKIELEYEASFWNSEKYIFIVE